jgi:hypothetical protein
MSRLAKVLSIAVVVGLVPLVSRVEAQKSKSSGLYLGLGFEGNGISTRAGGTTTNESGSGGDLTVGYGFSDRWSLYGQGSAASINAQGGGTYTLAHFDVGARLHFRTGPNTVVPFLQFGLAGRSVAQNLSGATVTGSGGGVSAGAGFNAHFTPAVALSAAATWTFGSFNQFEVDGQPIDGGTINATSARINIGLVWFP